MSEVEDDKKQPTGDYEVGYCRPPKANQWAPGQSGNPRGPLKRPKKQQQDIVRILREEMVAQINALEGGSEVKIDMMRFLAKQLVADFAKGTPPQRLRLFKELLNLGVLQPSSEAYENSAEERSKFLKDLAAKVGRVHDANGNHTDPNAPPRTP